MAKPVLGRGLSALLGGASAMSTSTPQTGSTTTTTTPAVPVAPPISSKDTVRHVPLNRVRPCPFQPRKDFTAESLQELAASIKEQGIVQPLIVRPSGDHFELIAGERRWRAAQSLSLADVPVIVREATDREVLELALIENLQRENLNPIEEAQGYGQLIGQFELTQEEVARKVGRSRAVVANALRLLRLPGEVQGYLRDNRISVGHAKVILGLPDDDQVLLATRRVIREGMNVRQTETFVTHLLQRSTTVTTRKSGASTARDVHVTDLESKLAEKFGTKVNLRYRSGKGSVEIKFFTDDELERILQLTGVQVG